MVLEIAATASSSPYVFSFCRAFVIRSLTASRRSPCQMGRLRIPAMNHKLLMLISVLLSSISWQAELHGQERTILFVDDHDVLYRAGTRRFLNLPVRHQSNPLITEDKPWEMAIGWTSVFRNPLTGKYQLWYQAYAGKRAQAKSHESVVCYAESDDGVAFIKPNLGLFDFNGDKQTNIVLIGNGVLGDRYCNSVIVDPRDAAESRRYKMAFTDWSKHPNGEISVGMHVAFSPDGIHWTKHSDAPRYRSYHGVKNVQPPFVGENPNHQLVLPDGRVRHQTRLPMTMSDAADVIFDPGHIH